METFENQCPPQSVMYVLLLVQICVIWLCSITGYSGELKYGVALTTIPPRFGVIHHQLQSWLDQTIAPQKMSIFIPRTYKRFRNKRATKDAGSYVEQLARHLHSTPSISSALTTHLIEIIEMNEDWGPLTKFIGTLMRTNTGSDSAGAADYWIFCDDDVTYSPQLAAHYASYVDSYRINPGAKYGFHSMGFTMFTTEQRLQFSLSGSAELSRVPHIQGVDSYIVPATAFMHSPSLSPQTVNVAADAQQVAEPVSTRFISPLSNVTNIMRIIRLFHSEWCPESFYQDDYLASYLLYLAGVHLLSARLAHPACYAEQGGVYAVSGVDCTKGIVMTTSIEGVSKHIFQMHMNDKVFMREYITQQCLMEHANQLHHMLYK